MTNENISSSGATLVAASTSTTTTSAADSKVQAAASVGNSAASAFKGKVLERREGGGCSGGGGSRRRHHRVVEFGVHDDDDDDEEENMLMREEDKMMMDEEITSVEDNHMEAVEETMMAVALVKSVVETSSPPPREEAETDGGGDDDEMAEKAPNRHEADSSAPGSAETKPPEQGVETKQPLVPEPTPPVALEVPSDGGAASGAPKAGSTALAPAATNPLSPPPYGLRRRRRPAGQDLQRLEHYQSTTEGGLARVTKKHPNEDSTATTTTSCGAPLPPPPPIPSAPPTTTALSSTGTQPSSSSSSHQDANKYSTDEIPVVRPPAAPLPPPQPLPSIVHSATFPKPSSPAPAPLPSSSALSSPSSAVPNPLSQLLHPGAFITCTYSEPSTAAHDVAAQQDPAEGSSNSHMGSGESSSMTPCPLLTQEQDRTSAEPADGNSEKRRVTIQETSGGRSRAYSIDMDLVLEFPDDSSASAPHFGGACRDRAFSFECFAFGINADEPLPPLGHSSANASGSLFFPSGASPAPVADVVTSRPRGDSIIFDPSSFQEGGIHEKNALENARETVLDTCAPASGSLGTQVQSNSIAKPAPVSSGATIALPTEMETRSNDVPVAVESVVSAPNLASDDPVVGLAGTSLNMEFLNKEGRIGIYLPEARRARIARFHAKRAKRIWRKRIKYDCRKKLADSRPRIKGRFVKRSDMEEE